MQDGVKLERKTKDELKQIAQGLGIEKISALKKDEIIVLIREKREQIANEEKQKVQPKKRERPADAVEVKGVLDVMTDGFGFLRMENYMSVSYTHLVAKTAERVIVMNDGHVEMQGTVAEVFAQAEHLQKIGLNVPQVTLLTDKLRLAGYDLPEHIYTVKYAADAIKKLIGGGGNV